MLNKNHDTLTKHPMHANIRASVPGMAHFAGTGPEGATCGKCAHWTISLNRRGSYVCAEYARMMHVEEGGKIPKNTPACRYFKTKG